MKKGRDAEKGVEESKGKSCQKRSVDKKVGRRMIEEEEITVRLHGKRTKMQ